MSAEGKNAQSITIIVTKGTLDWSYPPFILAAMDVKISMFFTFLACSC
jgi:peroxiredoxin family protein